MRIYGWVPESYGEWAYVLAESVEAARAALEKAKTQKDSSAWDYSYHIKMIDDFLSRPPDEIWEHNEVIFGEFA